MRSPLARSARTAIGEAAALVRRLNPARPGTARVLYYHRIDDEPHRSCVTPAAFAEQMAHLRHGGFHLMSLETMRAHLDEHRAFPDRTVVVTLDDGFADNYTQAFPILARESIPATIFLTAGFLDTPELPVLRDRRGVPPLTWAQAREMARSGIAMGAHTLSHATLTQVGDDDLRREVCGSRDLIAEKLGAVPSTFCYPRGFFDDRVKQAVRDAGFGLACTTLPGCVTPDTHHYSLRRTFIAREDTIRDFRNKLDGSFDLLHSTVQWWRGQSKSHPG